jgi:hypothetical protein
MLTRSPFPGMDPWIEGYWNDVHSRVIEEVADQIGAALPDGLFVSVQRDLYVVDPESPRTRQLYQPDVAVGDRGAELGHPGLSRTADDGGVAVAEPIRLAITDERVEQGHLEIRDLRDGRRLVTAVEVYSPTNKRGRVARAEYVRKRNAYFRGGANVVELDLLRAGRHLVAVSLDSLRDEDVTAYKCCVRRAGTAEAAATVEYYPLPLRERLPRVRIPLRPGDADAVVDLQQPIDVVYARRRLGEQIDYGRRLRPPLPPADAAWAAERIAAAGRT